MREIVQAFATVGRHGQSRREILQDPDNSGCDQDHSKCLADETEAVLKHVPKNSFCPGYLVGRHVPGRERQTGTKAGTA